MTISVGHLIRDDDPDTVDYTLRGDVTLNEDGSNVDACEGDGLGEDIEISVVDEVGEHFQVTFGAPGCPEGTYALTFVLTDSEGQEIRFRPFIFKVVDDGWHLAFDSLPGVVLDFLPVIDGAAQVGVSLTADTSRIQDADGLDNAIFAYQWIRSDGTTDADIAGATGNTYLVTTDDVGSVLKVRVSYTDDVGNDESLTSLSTPEVIAALPGIPQSLNVQPAGTGELSVSWQGPASNGGSEITGYKVQWKLASGNWDTSTDISEATSSGTSHTISSLQLDVEYAVRVIATNAIGDGPASNEVTATPVAQTSQQQAATQNNPAIGVPTTSGTALVGETLTAETSSIADADGLTNAAFAYQWIRSDGTTDTDISGETGSTYTPVSDGEGKTIKVRVSFTDDEGNDEALTSTATAAVEAALTAELQNVPGSHDGSGTFTFRILFSEPVTAGFSALKQHSFEITNATIKRAQRMDGRNDLRKFKVQPSSDSTVVLVLPATQDCADEGAICTSGGKRLSTRLEITVPGPAPANSAATGAPTISGTLEVGQTLTASTSGISDTDGVSNASFSYQWLADDTEISGATGSTYTLGDADEGKPIKVRASFTDDGGNEETLTSTATAAVQPRPNRPATGAPTITGTAQVGETLTAGTSAISDADGLTNVTFNYQWLADDAEISGATGSTYTLTDAEEGKAIKVRVSFTDDAGNDETLASAATGAVSPADQQQEEQEQPPEPTDRTHNLTATVDAGTVVLNWNAPDDSSGVTMYRILRHRPEEGESEPLVYVEYTHSTATNYTDTAVEAGTLYVYSVQAADFLGYVGEASNPASVRVPDPNSPAAGVPTISGTAQVGETLTADTSGISDADGLTNASFSYQWLSDDANISGATGSTYTLVDTDKGKAVKVRVSFTDDEGNDETLTSTATAAVEARPNRPATGAPSITGKTHVGATLTVDTSGISDADGLTNASFSYQWLSDDADVSGATGSTYTLVDTDEGKAIKVRVSFIDDEGNDETLTSAATSAVLAALTAEFLDIPSSHNGQTAFTFELRFSEEFVLSYVTLRDHAFTVTGGEVTKARRLDRESTTANIRWEITVTPNLSGDVTIVLPVTEDCNDQGAICTEDGRKLSNRTELTVAGSSG